MIRTTTLLLLAISFSNAAWAAATRVEGIRVAAGPDKTRVVLDVSGPSQHKIFTLTDPSRVVVDIARCRIDAARVAMPAARGSVARVRTGSREDGGLRVVLDLNQLVQAKSFSVPPEGKLGHRVVIDLLPRGAAPVKTVAATAERGRDVIVAVDAGHGGKDPGAIGRRGTREKDVTLAIAHKLKAQVDALPGMRAVLIRKNDYFVPLRDRMERARQLKADLFVSIHADAVRDRRAHGGSVYVLSEKGASSEAAARLAQRENSADLIGGVSLADKDEVLASVLLDLSQTAAISASTTAGEKVLRQVGRVGTLHQRKVQSANFAVLKSPDIPSLLVETAFISNPREEQRLKDPVTQSELARAIAAGIVDYFYEFPPPDSLIARTEEKPSILPVRHVISRGETLSGIAHRYKVSLSELRSSNGLKNDRIRIGQVLTIPST